MKLEGPNLVSDNASGSDQNENYLKSKEHFLFHQKHS